MNDNPTYTEAEIEAREAVYAAMREWAIQRRDGTLIIAALDALMAASRRAGVAALPCMGADSDDLSLDHYYDCGECRTCTARADTAASGSTEQEANA